MSLLKQEGVLVIESLIREIAFTLDAKSVKQYPYRTASVRDRFMEMKADSETLEELLRDLHLKLANAAGTRPDNHTVYEVTTSNDNRLYIMFHDLYVLFGLSVKEGLW